MVNKKTFFDKFRLEFGRLSQKQVDGFDAIIGAWNRSGLTDVRWLAYMLATCWHETGFTMQPVREIGRGRGYRYGRKIKRNGQAYAQPDQIYYGRGLVQLTWFENYQLMSRLIGKDLLNNPDEVLNMDTSIEIMFEGMTHGASSFGDFTGRSLEQYFNAKTDDPVNARRIINGTDKAEQIAGYHRKFLKCLK